MYSGSGLDFLIFGNPGFVISNGDFSMRTSGWMAGVMNATPVISSIVRFTEGRL